MTMTVNNLVADAVVHGVTICCPSFLLKPQKEKMKTTVNNLIKKMTMMNNLATTAAATAAGAVVVVVSVVEVTFTAYCS